MFKSKKKQIMFFFVSMIVIILVYLRSTSELEAFKERSMEVIQDYNIVNSLEHIEVRDGIIEFSGWALRLNSKNLGMKLVFHSVDNSDEKIISVDIEDKDDIAEYFDPDWDFGSCGFFGTIKQNKLKKEVCYEVLLILNYEEEQKVEDDVQVVQNVKKVSTGRYLYNNELYWYNPIEFIAPNVTDVAMQEVIQNGIVRAYDLEKEIWIYEYNSNLYWIINFSLFGSIEERLEIPLFIYTSQVEKLPKDKQDLGRDYIGYYLTEEDYLNNKEDFYYIYSTSLSKDYPITSVRTGIYQNQGENKGWIWETRFNFEK